MFKDKLKFSEKKQKYIKIIIQIILIIGAFGGGTFVANRSDKKEATSIVESKQVRQADADSEYDFINPLLECEIGQDMLNKFVPFEKVTKKRIQDEVIDKGDDFVSVYFRNLNNGPWFGINERENFTPASLMKVPLMIAFLKWTESEPKLLEQTVVARNIPSMGLQANIVSGEKIAFGQSYTIRQLMELMIMHSDNYAMQLLLEQIPQKKLDDIYIDLGITIPNIRKADDYMSVKDYASFFRILFNASYLNREQSEYALKLLSGSTYREGIVAGVGAEEIVAHKFGERSVASPNGKGGNIQLHDCGIVYAKFPYLLCVMTRGNDMQALSKSIAKISTIVHEEITKAE